MPRKFSLVSFMVVLTALVVIAAIFVRPRQPVRSLSNPDNLMANASVSGIWDTDFADKVMRTVFFALILNRDEYSARNAEALESLRSWAAREFHADPRFLHPVVIATPRANSTYINAAGFSLLAAPYFTASGLAGDFLEWRIATYNQSPSFKTFAANCFDFFGKRPECALMLARYQSDRAKGAIDPLLALAGGILALIFSPLAVARLAQKASAWRMDATDPAYRVAILAYASFSFSAFYFGQSILKEDLAAHSLLAALTSLVFGLYLLFPLKVFVDTQNVLVLRSTLTARTVTALTFIAGSLIVVQMLNWLKQGSLVAPDPLTLLICGFSGDFIHEPLQAKRTAALILAIIWSLGLAWTTRALSSRNAVSTREIAEKLAAHR